MFKCQNLRVAVYRHGDGGWGMAGGSLGVRGGRNGRVHAETDDNVARPTT